MDYLPTLGEKWPHSSGNVGKYSCPMAHLGIYLELSSQASQHIRYTTRPRGFQICFWELEDEGVVS